MTIPELIAHLQTIQARHRDPLAVVLGAPDEDLRPVTSIELVVDPIAEALTLVLRP